MQRIMEILNRRIREDQHELLIVRKRLERKTGNRIRVRRRNGRTEFYLITRSEADGKRHEKYVSPKNERLLSRQMNAEYAELAEGILESEIKLLEDFTRNFKPDEKYTILNRIPRELRRYAEPVCKTGIERAAEWAAEPYLRNSFPVSPGSAYKTRKGDTVRSRAECLALNILYELGLPYRYECGLELDGRGYVFPDITLMHVETSELWYVEIFGMMSDPDYAREAFEKIRRYQLAGLGARLLVFFDYQDVPFDPEAFEKTIRANFMPD